LGVINRYDGKSFDFLNDFIKVNKLNYGLGDDANICAVDIEYSSTGIKFTAVSKDFRADVSSNLVGAYNVSNCLAALASTVYGLGIDPQIAAQGIASLDGIPGRMENIALGQNFIAIVDFAHTPNALKVALEAARKMTKGRVISIFGSAGLRDKEKRRMMAETSIELADLSVLTAEDPRTESLDSILQEMAAGAVSKGGREGEAFWRVPDRGEAIKFALRLAREGDIVISCGKGHEQSMCFGKTEYLWDDRTAMRAALCEFLGIDGPRMSYLPSQDKDEKDWLKG
jgi:UDP-N-acetylmuramoyl-L-alanyl-D-glutamate--2,6-diaminopimelate ligase